MKILLSTIVDNVNYGTYLQAFATVKTLQDLGCDVDVLNYERKHLNFSFIFKTYWESGIKGKIKALPYSLLDIFNKINVKRFLSDKVSMTSKFTDWNKFKDYVKNYDVYLTGSDQVWNSIHNNGVDPVFFFDGISGVKKAYAASLGTESIPVSEVNRTKGLLEDYSFISVREKMGVEVLEKLGINNSVQVLDPTFLLDQNKWNQFSNIGFKKTEPYLLVYSVEKDKDADVLRIARKIAKERHLKIYYISPYIKFNRNIKVDKLFSMAGTDVFLSLFANADYTVVSSFHGTAFSINFNCQFVTVFPERFSTRVKSLLELLNLTDRYIKSENEIPRKEIDYKKTNALLEIERRKALTVLKNNIISK